MAFIGTFSRALLESATAVYFGGVPVSILDAQGNVILGDDLPDAPTVTSTIADRVYEIGAAPATVDLRTKFTGATSYTVSPANAAVTISDYTLTINPTATMTATTFTVRGINGGGASAPLTFALTVNAPSPVLLKPFPDQSLLIGGGTVTLPLAEYFSGAATYAVSPANQGVTISNGNLVISRVAARDVVITVTATNATGQDTADSFALVVGAPANRAPVVSGAIPTQAPVANVAFTSNLASYFSDPDGDTLLFDYTGTLPTGITRNGAVFSGTATVTGQTASGVLRARDPGNMEAEAPITWAVATQPALTAPTSSITQGQQAIVAFNALPDTVTITQSGVVLTATRIGVTNSYNFTPLTTDPVAISAIKAGYSPYNATWNVQPAPPALVITSANTGRITGVDAASAPFDFQIIQPARYAGTRTVTPSQMTTGPVAHVAPTQTGTGAVGQVLTGDPGLWLTLDDDVSLTYRWTRRTTANASETPVVIAGATGTAYTLTAADQGKTLRFEVVASDQHGERTATATGTAVPAAATGIDTFDVVRADLHGATTESGETWTRLFGTNPGKLTVNANGEVVTSADAASTPPIRYARGALDRGATQHVWAEILRTGGVNAWPNVSLGICMQQNDYRAYYWNVEDTRISLIRYAADGTATTLIDMTKISTDWPVWAVGETFRWDLKRSSAGLITVEMNGALLLQRTDTTLSGGACGLIAKGANTGFRTTKFGIGA
ncbi:MAG: hypothetical protein FJX25_02500 [Alphaproteobacteria bacterium]|nr:hypothetical protein [Alphaproteobacteria bacterium]